MSRSISLCVSVSAVDLDDAQDHLACIGSLANHGAQTKSALVILAALELLRKKKPQVIGDLFRRIV